MPITDSLLMTSTPPIPKKTHRFKFHGAGRDLFGVFLLNLLKTIATFGVYYFWGKVKTRQFVWGQTEFSGDRFGYHGTGLELLIGWGKAAFLFGSVIILESVMELNGHQFIGALLLWTGIACLIPIAQIGALRYRLSRSSWRSIRFSFQGQMKPFFLLSLKGLILTAVTLGVFYPFYECRSRAYLVGHSRFGTSRFQFNGQPKDLLRIYTRHAIAMMGGLAILGAILFPLRDHLTTEDSSTAAITGFAMFVPFALLYGAILLSLIVKRRQFYWNHTSFAGVRFNTTVTMSNLLVLYVNNLFLVVLTLGLAFPWVTVRSRRYDCEHLKLIGSLDLDAIQQHARSTMAVGEELSSLLEVDAIPS